VLENQQRKAPQIPLEANRKEPMTYPASYRYTTQHEWIDVKDNVGTIGITDYAQHELGDVVFVELPKTGAKVEVGKSFGNVESVKAVSEIYAPVSGEVLEANADLEASPEKLNSDPHTAAWLVRIKLTDPSQLSKLMDAKAYEAFIAAKDKEASA
jgi:glycine cleavage system H protein